MATKSRNELTREALAKDEAFYQCIQVNKDNPLAVAETIKEAFEALGRIKKRLIFINDNTDPIEQLIDAVLAKANKKGE